MLEPGVGYVRVSQFQEHTVDAMARQLEQMGKNGPLQSIILDLRNDPGGLLHGAVGVSAAYLPPRVQVVSTDGRTEDAKRKYLAAPEDYLRGSRDDVIARLPAWTKTAKMVVLVNAGSASASEIVAGALQDHKRAVVLGTQTFGKGSVQSILPLTNNTAIKLTTARYYTPSGKSIQARGIAPDFVVEETPEGDITAFRVREADLQRHLSNGKDAAEEVKSLATTQAELDKLRDRKPVEFGSADDYQLRQALNYLKGLPVVLAKSTIDKAPDGASDAATANEAAAIRSLKEGTPPRPAPTAPAR
jgi:carboxyl-terminal processing protease